MEKKSSSDSEIIYAAPAFTNKEDGVTFIGESSYIDINQYEDLIWCILSTSNGISSKADIIEYCSDLTNQSRESVEAIINDLESLHILLPATEQYRRFHAITNNPQPYAQKLGSEALQLLMNTDSFRGMEGEEYCLSSAHSEIASLAYSRESVRSFEDTPLSLEQIGELLNGAYSSNKRAVPSAGGLYPIRVNLIASSSDIDYRTGYYQYNYKNETLICYNDEIDERQLRYIFSNEDVLFNAPAVFVISADLERQPAKYSNRGYRFTLLEAGHVAQNMHIIAQELGLSTLEYGGFQDEALTKELQLSDQNAEPIIALAIGHKAHELSNHEYLTQQVGRLQEQLVGEDKPIDWCSVYQPSSHSLNIDLQLATAQYKIADKHEYGGTGKAYAGGAGLSTEQAQIKALAEAYERHMCGNFRIDHVSTAEDLGLKWIDPNQVAPMTKKQFQVHNELRSFSPDEAWEWVEGYSSKTGESIMVPVDLVFYPIHNKNIERKLCTHANSSGVAAHKTREAAMQNGLLELIERDAIMRNWFNKDSPLKFDPEYLDTHWQKKIHSWQQYGFVTDILDLSHDGVAIVNVAVHNQNETYPYFVNGSSASIEGYSAAIEKAFLEAETDLAEALSSTKEPLSRIEEIRSPSDHGLLYLYPQLKHEVEWMWQGKTTQPNYMEMASFSKLIDKYKPTVVDLASHESPLQVVRMISPKLIPINFGYMCDYYSHPEAQKNISPLYNPKIPHFFA